jgi:hypothetical protein
MKIWAVVAGMLILLSGGIVWELHNVRVALEKVSADIRDDWQRAEGTRMRIASVSEQLEKDTIRLRTMLKGGK